MTTAHTFLCYKCKFYIFLGCFLIMVCSFMRDIRIQMQGKICVFIDQFRTLWNHLVFCRYRSYPRSIYKNIPSKSPKNLIYLYDWLTLLPLWKQILEFHSMSVCIFSKINWNESHTFWNWLIQVSLENLVLFSNNLPNNIIFIALAYQNVIFCFLAIQKIGRYQLWVKVNKVFYTTCSPPAMKAK